MRRKNPRMSATVSSVLSLGYRIFLFVFLKLFGIVAMSVVFCDGLFLLLLSRKVVFFLRTTFQTSFLQQRTTNTKAFCLL